MTGQSITATEFERRLGELCQGSVTVFPRRVRDRQIVLRGIIHGLDPELRYSEGRINELLAVGAGIIGLQIDHVTLRRHLVDAGFLNRDASGLVYQVILAGNCTIKFEPGVSEVDPVEVVKQAQQEASRRKRTRLGV